jgi:hypothetical protein
MINTLNNYRLGLNERHARATAFQNKALDWKELLDYEQIEKFYKIG